MLSRLFGATARHRRPVLVAGVLAAVGYLAAARRHPSVDDQGFPVAAAIILVCGVLMTAAWVRHRPRSFLVRPGTPAFVAPPSAGPVYSALAFLALFTVSAGAYLGQADRALLVLLAGWLLVVAVHISVAWRDLGAQLRPDGLRNAGILGTVVAPWEALPVPHRPGPRRQPDVVELTFAHPELVQRRGVVLRRSRLHTHNIDGAFLADAVRHYATRPECRAEIGTEAGYRRLLDATTGSSAAPAATPGGDDP